MSRPFLISYFYPSQGDAGRLANGHPATIADVPPANDHYYSAFNGGMAHVWAAVDSHLASSFPHPNQGLYGMKLARKNHVETVACRHWPAGKTLSFLQDLRHENIFLLSFYNN